MFIYCKCKYEVNEFLVFSFVRKNEIVEIVKFYGVIVKRKNVCIFMEYMVGKKNMVNLVKFFFVFCGN